MGYWRIQYIKRSRGERADQLADLLSAGELRAARRMDPKAWEQVLDILRSATERGASK